jgi:hypothetical protein
MVYDGHMATDSALPDFTITPPAASICRMVTITDTNVPNAAGRFFFHFERFPTEPKWLLSAASFQPTGGENHPISAARAWNYASDADAADAEIMPTALAACPWLPALIEHARPVF